MEMSTRDYQEKRSFIRMKLECPALISLPGEDRDSLCSNLSGGGMLLVLDEPIEVGSEHVVCIKSHFGHGPMLTAKTRVIRSEIYNEKCHAGLSILELLEHR